MTENNHPIVDHEMQCEEYYEMEDIFQDTERMRNLIRSAENLKEICEKLDEIYILTIYAKSAAKKSGFPDIYERTHKLGAFATLYSVEIEKWVHELENAV
jgi:hypothetical protein